MYIIGGTSVSFQENLIPNWGIYGKIMWTCVVRMKILGCIEKRCCKNREFLTTAKKNLCTERSNI